AVAVVNRDRNNSRSIDINLQNFTPSASTVTGHELANLGASETFVSHASNALVAKQYTVTNSHITFTAPKLSVTLIRIPASVASAVSQEDDRNEIFIFPNPATSSVNIRMEKPGPYSVRIMDMTGRVIRSENI